MRFKWLVLFMLAFSCNEQSGDLANTQGSGGSLSRFALSGNYLYLVTNSTLNVFDLSENNFQEISKMPLAFGLETIQVNSSFLYMGARDAMYIYSIANPSQPEFVFRYAHIVSCDPVVVQGNRAYVTLRSGNICNLGSNSLEIIDITNPYNPSLIRQYQMTSPGGLGIFGNCLFVCEGEAGLKMLNVANDEIHLVNELKAVNAYDVIVKNGSFTLTGEDGIFQYRYDCELASMEIISSIPVVRADF